MLSVEVYPFGKLDDQTIQLFTLRNQTSEVRITNYGGIVTGWDVPDRNGKMDDIVLGFNNLENYLGEHPYFGAIVGRYANRIAKGKFQINGKDYILAKNNGNNSLHGGISGFSHKIWDYEINEGKDRVAVELSRVSPHMEEGFPGNLEVKVSYSLDIHDQLRIDYFAHTDMDTICNLTNHCYFNLKGAGNGTILDHQLQLDALYFTPVNSDLIPTGEFLSVDSTPFDFRESKTLISDIHSDHPQMVLGHGYDHNFVLDKEVGELRKCAEVRSEFSGRVLEVLTTEPGIQLYTGNWLDSNILGKNGREYVRFAGFCLETQHFPDTPNQEHFPPVLIKAGSSYSSTTIYRVYVQ